MRIFIGCDVFDQMRYLAKGSVIIIYSSVTDPDPFLIPGSRSGMGDKFFLDPESRILHPGSQIQLTEFSNFFC
jgi:hypothetical protein